MDHCEILVLGGGVAGLACAWTLRQAGRDVLLLEADHEVGGNVRSAEVEGFLLERGPHTLLASADHVFALADDLGLTDELVASRAQAAARFVARRGRLHVMPSGAWSFLTTSLLSPWSKLTLASEPLRWKRGQPQDTAAAFFERRFGAEAARVLAGAFISGVYAGDPQLLSAPAAFPLFWGFEQSHGSMILGAMAYFRRRAAARKAAGEGPATRQGLYSFRQGLGQLSATIGQRLGERCLTSQPARRVARDGERWLVETDTRSLRASSLVVAVPPGEAARLLVDANPQLAALLEGIPMAPVAVVQLGFHQRQAAIPEGFGFLVPRGEDIRSLGVLFPSRLFDDRTPNGGDLLVGFVGGMSDPRALELADDELAQIVLGDLGDLTGLDATPDLLRVRRYPNAIPQLILGHLERMDRLRQLLGGLPGLHLAGNYLKGVGLKDAVQAGLDSAAQLGAER